MSHISNVCSRIFGSLACTRFPAPIQGFINRKYVKWLKLDMSEFDAPNRYKSLNELFTRSFKIARDIAEDESVLLSPCDSWISEAGLIDEFKALQIKGFSYSINTLLGDFTLGRERARLEGGIFMNFYLSPADYHRYHSPCDMKILKATHITGRLYPVNLKWLNKKAELFAQNERVVLECESSKGARFYLVFVGALNVGKMKFHFDKRICTNVKSSFNNLYTYKDIYIKQGEELGFFEMGSTIVFLGEKEAFKALAKQGDKVKFGDRIIGVE
ncbi:MAG: phosphatidylserine decarboxylase [Campylobacteraceae bacterium]|nr:phosphatidylserine decarboxylase [Campylobacteraceae bacterium]